MVFSPALYLRGLGWSGPGSSLQPENKHARVKPITVPQKNTLSGIGKDRDTAYPWWEFVFTTAVSKAEGDNDAHHRTSTGILSNRPPPLRTTLPDRDPAQPSSPRMSLLDQAKQESARRQLYSNFLKGKMIDSSLEVDLLTGVKEQQEGEREKREREDREVERLGRKRMRRGKKGSGTDSDSDSGSEKVVKVVAVPVKEEQSKEERRARRAAKKELRKSQLASTSTLPASVPSPASSLPSPDAAPTAASTKSKSRSRSRDAPTPPTAPKAEAASSEFELALKAAKRVLKLQRRAAKEAGKAGKEDEGKNSKKRSRDV